MAEVEPGSAKMLQDFDIKGVGIPILLFDISMVAWLEIRMVEAPTDLAWSAESMMYFYD